MARTKKKKERLIEFVKYHKNGDGECNNVVLKDWAERHCHGLQEKYELAYFFSITYCVESAIVLFEKKDEIYKDITAWIKDNKDLIVFQSNRKRAQNYNMTMAQFLHNNWNNPKGALSPMKGYGGCLKADRIDENGDVVYKYVGKKEE